MEKSIYSAEYEMFLDQLRRTRQEADLSQGELGEKLGRTQSWISKVERGERRLDIVELRAICEALGVSLLEFVTIMETRRKIGS